MKVLLFTVNKMSLAARSYDSIKEFGGVSRNNYSWSGELTVTADPPSDIDLLDALCGTLRHDFHLSQFSMHPITTDVFVLEKETEKKAYFLDKQGWVDITDEWFATRSEKNEKTSSATTPVQSGWVKPVQVDDEYVSKNTIRNMMCATKTLSGRHNVVFEEDIEDMPAAPNVVEVVFCKDCIGHGQCAMEDVFLSAGIEQPFCCGGNKKNEKDH